MDFLHCCPPLLQDVWFLEKLAYFDREVIPERRMHAKGSGAFGTFTVTHDNTKYTRAKLFSQIGKKTELFARFSTVAGERGAYDAIGCQGLLALDPGGGSPPGAPPG
jgi:catalase